MEQHETKLAERKSLREFEVAPGDDELVSQRLNWLLAENDKFKSGTFVNREEIETAEATAMRHPMSLEQAFSYFGLMLGIFPPAVFFIKFGLESRGAEPWLFGLFAITNLLAAVIGFFSGKVVAKVVRTLETMSWPAMVVLLPFLGLVWGIVTGAGSGIVIVIVGALVGGVIGGLVGAAALPAFTMLHRLVKKGEYIDRSQFLPIAMGVTTIVCAFIAGFKN